MKQNELLLRLIRCLLAEQPRYADMEIPAQPEEQRQLLRSLMNVREPGPADPEFLEMQDAYLQLRLRERGVTDYRELTPIRPRLYLWRGDITLLRCDAIVNAANEGMTGCYRPCHACIDNCIHTYAGVQLRQRCGELMEAQGHPEPTGQCKCTPAYNLPSRFVLHTVGPIVSGALTPWHEGMLKSCYLRCLETAESAGAESVAFCCISTGVFRFPAPRAAQIAVETVSGWQSRHPDMDVIFNVFSEKDDALYRQILADC